MTSKLALTLTPWATSVFVSWFLVVAQARADSIIQLPVSTCTVTKGIGRLAVPVQRQNDLSNVTSVKLATVASTAVDGIDYAGTNTELTFQAGETQRVVHIPIFNDGILANNKTFNVLISDPTAGGALGSRTNLKVTIANNNQGLHFYLPAVTVNEDEGKVEIKVARGDYGDKRVSVDYATTDGTAKAGQDYASTAGTISFDPGEVLKSITIPILNDTLPEPTKTFKVVLSNPQGGAVLGLPSVVPSVMTVTINDTDQMVQLELPNYWVREESEYGQVGITRGESDREGTVDFTTSDKTALAGVDYVGVTNTIRFGPGESLKWARVPILNNNLKNSLRNFSVGLSNPSGAAILGTNRLVSVSIYDNDLGLRFPKTQYSVTDRAEVVNVAVARGNDERQSSFTVDFHTVAGSAREGVDYKSVSGTLRFQENESLQSIAIPILSNPTAYGTNKFTLSLSNPSNSAEITAGTATVSILHLGSSWPIIPTVDANLKLKLEDNVSVTTWENDGLLQHAEQVTGPWEDLNRAASPYATRPALASGFYQIKSTRPTAVYVPSQYDGRTPLPLFLALHGWDFDQAQFSPLESLAESDSKGFLVCRPAGIRAATWVGADYLWEDLPENVDDLSYLHSVIEEIRRQFAVDPKRIYSVGFNSGGAMSARLAGEYSDLIAGITCISAQTSYDPQSLHPNQPVNVLIIGGSDDITWPYNGGYLGNNYLATGYNSYGEPITGELPGSVRSAQIWAELNKSQDPVVGVPSFAWKPSAKPDTTILRYNQCPPGGAVEHWTINNSDHWGNGGNSWQNSDNAFRPWVEWLLAHPKP